MDIEMEIISETIEPKQRRLLKNNRIGTKFEVPPSPVELKEGHKYCVECNGTCYQMSDVPVEKDYYFKCPGCFGTGTFDWVEEIVGKQNPNYYTDWLDNYGTVQLPMMRKAYPKLVAKDLVAVSPSIDLNAKIFHMKAKKK